MYGDDTKPLMISVIIPVYNAASVLSQCLEAVFSSNYSLFECIVVDDGSTDNAKKIAGRFPARYLELVGGPMGPAYARNYGSQQATGDILLFIDSDVVVHPDTIEKVSAAFQQNPQVDAIFGSYDENPGDGEFLSQYKNLTHHFVHQQGKEEASTFWSGCGAVRRKVFLDVGGFDVVRFPRPSIEDIDLGARLKAMGHSIQINKQVMVTHLKRWTLRGLIKTDIIDRALPWTLLIMRQRDLPNDLNLNASQRISAILSLIFIGFVGLSLTALHSILLALLAGLFLVIVNLWSWKKGDTHFLIDEKKKVIAFGFVTLAAILALFGDLGVLIPLLGVLFFLLLLAGLMQSSNPGSQKFVFFTLLSTNTIALIVVLINTPYIFWLLPVLTLGLIVLLNWRLYVFYMRQRGLVFTYAALHYQVLYYIYSMFAFIIGVSLHSWNTLLKPR